MKSLSVLCIHLLITAASSQLLVQLFDHDPAPQQPQQQQPLQMDTSSGPVGPTNGGGSGGGGVMLSDVMGRDRSINVFASFTRDVPAIERRLDDAAHNSTILAPRNSAIDRLPRKPWEDPTDYETLGANAYEGDDGRERAQRNLARFVEAHIVPTSPWREGERARTILGDREVWWENKDGKKVIQPDNIEVDSVASRTGNGELWIINGVRNYS